MERLFPVDLPACEWLEFAAEGFPEAVSGIIYRADQPASNGMPLGGIDTGCIDVETTGMFGLTSVFNSLAPRRGPLHAPFLGLQVDERTFCLAAHGMPGVESPRKISQWGHYPIADMEFELDCPLSIGLRAWSPFVPGSTEASTIPGTVLEVHLRNDSGQPLAGKLAMTFPGFERYEAKYAPIRRIGIKGPVSGGLASAGRYEATRETELRDPSRMNYVLGVMGDVPVRLGYHLGWDASAWQRMGEITSPMQEDHDNSGMSVAVDFSLAARDSQVTRFVLAWYAPVWCSGGSRPAGGNTYTHMYARRFANAHEVALYLAREHDSLLRRVLAWQQVIYGEQALPPWLRDSLVNILHLITETSVWAQARSPIGDWCRPEDGLFGLNECPRGCPQVECLPCSFYGNLPIVYFFPQLALSTLRGYKAYQFDDGRPSWVFGGVTTGTGYYEMALPDKGYQTALNGSCVVEMVDKLWLRTGDDELLHEFYDLCKRATLFTMNLRPEYGDKQVISMPTGNEGTEWFEAPEPGWAGMATHVGGIRLAHLSIMERMADRMHDEAFAAQCRQWFAAGAKALEEHLWAGESYLNFYEPETGRKSDLVFGYQLDGQWIAKFHGVEGAFPEERVRIVLATIKRCNVALSKSGAVNYAHLNGSPAPVGGYGTYSYFPPELLMLAMTYMYQGEKDLGLELARRCWENIVCIQRLAWDQPNFLRGDVDSGERVFGNDYYQNMMLWSLPAALAGQDLTAPCAPGGLVQRIIEAGAS